MSIEGAGSEAAVAALAKQTVVTEAVVAARAAASVRLGRLATAAKIGGRLVVFAGVASSGYQIYVAENRWKETARKAGGWAGAASCGYALACGGFAVGGPWGAAAGGIAGSIGGFFAGAKAGQNCYEFFFEPGLSQ